MHTLADTARLITGRAADYVMTVKANMPTLAKLAVTLALGGDCPADIGVPRSQPGLFGPVASAPGRVAAGQGAGRGGRFVLRLRTPARDPRRPRPPQRSSSSVPPVRRRRQAPG